jgi:hypothetical protein
METMEVEDVVQPGPSKESNQNAPKKSDNLPW